MQLFKRLNSAIAGGFFFALFLLPCPGHAQKENNVWYFGNGAGLDFNGGSPVPLTNGALFTTEGCASIADTSGSLLFYTDGVTVYNKVHNVMPNGTGLFGGNSSSESAIIVPLPGSLTTFYIFTTPDQGSLNGLNYSIVDMTQQGGFGDVTSKNNLLHAPIGEKVCATRQINGTDYWIVAHEFATDAFYAFEFSSAGMNPVPVVSNVGLVHNGYHGYLKFNMDGSKIGLAVGESDQIELFDFDKSTGVVSNPVTFPTTYHYPYGVEFSPDNSKFCVALSGVGGLPGLYQFDMLAGSPAAIIASGQQVGNVSNTYFGPLQLAPDGKIYCGPYPTGNISVINDPNTTGWACNYVDAAISLNGGICTFGLPNQIPHVNFAPVAVFTSPNHICPGTCTDFTNLSQFATDFLWAFSGANPSSSTDLNPANICYNSPGQYDVMLISSNGIASDTLLLLNYITVYPYPPPQGILQSGDTLFSNLGFTSYQWYYNGTVIPGATNYYLVALSSGDYNVVCTDENNCEVEAAIFNVIAGIATFDPSSGNFEVVPNPVKEYFGLVIPAEVGSSMGMNGLVSISNYDLPGNLVFEERIQNGESILSGNSNSDSHVRRIDVSVLPPSLDILKIKNEHGSFVTRFCKL